MGENMPHSPIAGEWDMETAITMCAQNNKCLWHFKLQMFESFFNQLPKKLSETFKMYVYV